MQNFSAQSCEIYRPYADDIPWELIESAAPNLNLDLVHRDITRVAKYQEKTVGVYVFFRRSILEYDLWALAVEPPFRRRGLGRWLMGHAIGLAESKGGRELCVPSVVKMPARALLAGLGFEEVGQGYRFRFIPE